MLRIKSHLALSCFGFLLTAGVLADCPYAGSVEPALKSSMPLLSAMVQASSESKSGPADYYAVLLHSHSLAKQRGALRKILDNPQKFVPSIQQSLRDYPRLLRTDPTAAKRAVYLSALVRDPSFPPFLVKSLAVPDVIDGCEYACPVVFALTIFAGFGGWRVPADLNSKLTTVHDLKEGIANLSRIRLKVGSLEDVVQGREVEKYREELKGKTEAQLIQLAGPTTWSTETRMFAAFRLETLVTGSEYRIRLYLLAMNDFEDASGEYRSAVYQSIYRAELAKAQDK